MRTSRRKSFRDWVKCLFMVCLQNRDSQSFKNVPARGLLRQVEDLCISARWILSPCDAEAWIHPFGQDFLTDARPREWTRRESKGIVRFEGRSRGDGERTGMNRQRGALCISARWILSPCDAEAWIHPFGQDFLTDARPREWTRRGSKGIVRFDGRSRGDGKRTGIKSPALRYEALRASEHRAAMSRVPPPPSSHPRSSFWRAPCSFPSNSISVGAVRNAWHSVPRPCLFRSRQSSRSRWLPPPPPHN